MNILDTDTMGTTLPAETSILVVDDDSDVRSAMIRIVKKAGYTVYQAGTGNECLETARKHKPDIILLDVGLPDMTGFEVCKTLKADKSLVRTHIIFVSGIYKDSNKQAEGLDLGGDGYITRPFSNREFLARVEALVRLQRTERALDHHRTWLNTILRSMNEAVIATNCRGQVTFFNPLAEMITGWGIKSAVGRSLSEILRFDGLEIPQIVDDTLLTDVSKYLYGKFDADLVLIRPDGEMMPVRAQTATMFNTEGDPQGMVVLIRNISRRKRAEDQLRLYTDRLEEIAKARTVELRRSQESVDRQEWFETIGRVIPGIGDDIGQHLDILTNAVVHLKTVLVDVPDKTREYFDEMADELVRAGGVVTDLVCLATEPTPNPVVLSIDTLITNSLSKNPPPRGVGNTVRDLPVAEILMDKGHFEHIVTNLLMNAYESMPDGGSVVIKGIEDASRVKVSIIDSGVGIKKENRDHVFDPLYTTKSKRTGLGLCIADRLIRANGGSIEIISEVGVGTTVTISLPKASQ